MLTTANSPIFTDFQPTYDATCVARLRAARGIMIGKAQMGPLAGGRALLPGTNIPTTRNAWTPDDIRYSPSGSSGAPPPRWRPAWPVRDRDADRRVDHQPRPGPGPDRVQADVRAPCRSTA